MKDLVARLQQDFPKLSFAYGEVFSWSPTDQCITIGNKADEHGSQSWSLLHEVGHALLEHTTYRSDIELIKLEAAAWDKAVELAHIYDIEIDPDHIQDCLDTYRDWLHRRSTCPACETVSLQRDSTTYCCYNCNAEWTVSHTKLCRPYRRLNPQKLLTNLSV